MKKILLVVILLFTGRLFAQSNFQFNPAVGVTVKSDLTTTFSLGASTLVATPSTSFSVTNFSKPGGTNYSFLPIVSVTSQADLTAQFNLGLATFQSNIGTNFSVTSFNKPGQNISFTPSMSVNTLANLNATFNLDATSFGIGATTGLSVTTFGISSVRNYSFSPTAAATTNLVAKYGPGWAATVAARAQADLSAQASVGPVTASVTNTLTSAYDSNGSVAGIGVALGMVPTFVKTGSQVFAVNASDSTSLAAKNNVGQTPLISDATATSIQAALGWTLAPSITTNLGATFIKNSAPQSLSATLATTTSVGVNFNAAPSTSLITDTTTLLARLSTVNNNGTTAATTTGATAAFSLAIHFNPTIGVATNMGISQFGGTSSFTYAPQQTVITAFNANISDTISPITSASDGTQMSAGFGSTLHPVAADSTAMVCSFSVHRFNSNRKIMQVIS